MDTAPKLRAISYVHPATGDHTAFVAMTDDEFTEFQQNQPYSLKPYRILYVLAGATPSEADCKTALDIFYRVYGRKVIAPHCFSCQNEISAGT